MILADQSFNPLHHINMIFIGYINFIQCFCQSLPIFLTFSSWSYKKFLKHLYDILLG